MSNRIVADLLINDPRLYRTSAQLIGIGPSQTPYEEFLAMNEESMIPKLSVGEFLEYATAMMKPILESLNVRFVECDLLGKARRALRRFG